MWIGSWGACCSIQGELCSGSYLAICQGTRPYANKECFYYSVLAEEKELAAD